MSPYSVPKAQFDGSYMLRVNLSGSAEICQIAGLQSTVNGSIGNRRRTALGELMIVYDVM